MCIILFSMLKSDILRLFFSYAAQDLHSRSRFVNSWFFYSPILCFVYEFEGKNTSTLLLVLAYLIWWILVYLSRPPSLNRFIRSFLFEDLKSYEFLFIILYSSFLFRIQIRSHSVISCCTYYLWELFVILFAVGPCFLVYCDEIFLHSLWSEIIMLEMVQ